MRSSPVVLDQVDAAFDDERAVANAGLLLPATLVARLGLEQAADQLINLGERPGAARPGRKILTVVHSLVAGGAGKAATQRRWDRRGDAAREVDPARSRSSATSLPATPGRTTQQRPPIGAVAPVVGLPAWQ
jgi:hypothetical protein